MWLIKKMPPTGITRIINCPWPLNSMSLEALLFLLLSHSLITGWLVTLCKALNIDYYCKSICMLFFTKPNSL